MYTYVARCVLRNKYTPPLVYDHSYQSMFTNTIRVGLVSLNNWLYR